MTSLLPRRETHEFPSTVRPILRSLLARSAPGSAPPRANENRLLFYEPAGAAQSAGALPGPNSRGQVRRAWGGVPGGVPQGWGIHVTGVSPARARVPVARGAGRDPELQPPPLQIAGARGRAVGLTGSVPAAASPGALAARTDARSPRGRENGPGLSASPGPGGQGKAPRTQPGAGAGPGPRPGPAGWWRSRPRAPLEEIQLGAGGPKKVPESSAASKDASAVEFVADPAALAGILSNVRLCSPALGPGGKPSLARRIPLRGSRGSSLLAQGNRKGSRASSLSTHGSVPPRRDSARGSCLSAAGQEGLEAWAAPSPFGRVPVKKATPGAHPSPFGRVLANKLQSAVCADAPGTHASPVGRAPAMTPLPTGSMTSLLGTCKGMPPRGHSARLSCLSTMGQEGLPRVPHTSDVHFSPFSHTPVTQPQSTPNPACAREMGDRHQLHVEQTPGRCGAGQPPQPCSPDVGGNDPREMAQPWEKVAVRRLFEDEDEDSQGDLGGSHSQAPAQVGTPHGISKEQHVPRLLQKAVEGVDGATPLDELQALLAAYPPSCPLVPPCCASVPGLVLGDRGLDPAARAVPQGGTAGFQGAGTTLTFSSLRPLCASPPIHSLRAPGPPAAGTMLAVRPSRLALVKQRLDSLLRAPQRFLDACLDDECAFYTGRAPAPRALPSRTCPNPVALQLEAQDAAYFVSISPPGPRAPSSAPAASLPQPARPPEGDIGAGGPTLGLLEDRAPASSTLTV